MEMTGYLATANRPRPALLAGVTTMTAAGLIAIALLAPQIEKAIKKELPVATYPLDPIRIPPEIKKVEAKVPVAKPIPTHRETPADIAPDTAPLAQDPQPWVTTGTGGTDIGIDNPPKIDPVKDPVIVASRFTGGKAQPPYPPALARLEIEGSVTVRVLVGVDGRPVRIEAVRSDQAAFFTATRDWAMRNWRFTPATRDGVPFEEWRTMTVTFRLD